MCIIQNSIRCFFILHTELTEAYEKKLKSMKKYIDHIPIQNFFLAGVFKNLKM